MQRKYLDSLQPHVQLPPQVSKNESACSRANQFICQVLYIISFDSINNSFLGLIVSYSLLTVPMSQIFLQVFHLQIQHWNFLCGALSNFNFKIY